MLATGVPLPLRHKNDHLEEHSIHRLVLIMIQNDTRNGHLLFFILSCLAWSLMSGILDANIDCKLSKLKYSKLERLTAAK